MVENDIPLPRLIATDRNLACTNATETVFPLADKLLCRWHIRRNVLAQTKKKIGTVENTLAVDVFMAKFDATIDAATEEEFNEGCAVLRRLSVEMAIYFDRNWWPYKEQIANCWTNNYIHFGCRDTSTVEGTHATMKSWLDNSQGDLLRVFQALLPRWMKLALNNSLSAANDACNIPTLFRGDKRYSNVVKIISVWAILQTHRLWKKAHTIVVHGLERSTCDGTFRRIHGRPCLHDLIAIIESNDEIRLVPEQYDVHWWLPAARSTETTGVGDPTSRRDRPRVQNQPRLHTRGFGSRSTRRALSSFELIEQNLAAERANASVAMSFTELLESDHTSEFQPSFLPPRAWSYAGLGSQGD